MALIVKKLNAAVADTPADIFTVAVTHDGPVRVYVKNVGSVALGGAGEADVKIAPKDARAPEAAVAALAGAGAGNVDNGTHSYKVTFVTDDGETEGGATSNVVTVVDKTVNGKVNLIGIPVGHQDVTARKLYRTVAGDVGAHKLLATIADNATTTYQDNTADAGLGADAPTVGPVPVHVIDSATFQGLGAGASASVIIAEPIGYLALKLGGAGGATTVNVFVIGADGGR